MSMRDFYRLDVEDLNATERHFDSMAAEQGEASAIRNRRLVARLIAEIRYLWSEARPARSLTANTEAPPRLSDQGSGAKP